MEQGRQDFRRRPPPRPTALVPGHRPAHACIWIGQGVEQGRHNLRRRRCRARRPQRHSSLPAHAAASRSVGRGARPSQPPVSPLPRPPPGAIAARPRTPASRSVRAWSKAVTTSRCRRRGDQPPQRHSSPYACGWIGEGVEQGRHNLRCRRRRAQPPSTMHPYAVAGSVRVWSKAVTTSGVAAAAPQLQRQSSPYACGWIGEGVEQGRQNLWCRRRGAQPSAMAACPRTPASGSVAWSEAVRPLVSPRRPATQRPSSLPAHACIRIGEGVERGRQNLRCRRRAQPPTLERLPGVYSTATRETLDQFF